MRRIPSVLIVVALALPMTSACMSSPPMRAVELGPVDTGAGSIESVRRQLKGSWELVTLVLVAPGGDKTPVTASGRLQYDEYGNMSIRGNVAGSPQLDPAMLNLTGQVTIDPVAHSFRFHSIKAATADERYVDPKLDATNVRYYEFAGDQMTTTIKDAAGAPTAIATWKKVG